MSNTIANRTNVIQWPLLAQLDDLSYANDLTLSADAGERTMSVLDNVSSQLGLNIHRVKTKIARLDI